MGYAPPGRANMGRRATRTRLVAAGLLVTLMPQLSGCTVNTAMDIRPAKLKPQERSQPGEPRLVAVVTEWGRRYDLDSVPPPRMQGDTLYAQVSGRPYLVPRAGIRRLLMSRPRQDTVAVTTSSLGVATELALGPRIRGLRTVTGTEVNFDSTTAVYVAADTVHGLVGGAPVQIALPDVDRLTVVRRDEAVYTVSSVAAGGVAVLFLAALISCAKKGTCATGGGLPSFNN